MEKKISCIFSSKVHETYRNENTAIRFSKYIYECRPLNDFVQYRLDKIPSSICQASSTIIRLYVNQEFVHRASHMSTWKKY